jgi:hypothetical protein
MKIAIVGSRGYTNRKKIKDFVFKLKEKFGDELEIVSGGQKDGADGYAKKFSLEFDIKYVEFPPQHYSHNIHCVKESFNYGKPYAVWNYFKRNKEIAEYSDKIVAFIPDGVKSNGTMNTIEHAEKLNKKSIIID